MPCLTNTPEFQARLAEAYRAGGLVPEDLLIHLAATNPAKVFTHSRALVERVIFALERYAAILSQPHPCLQNIAIDYMGWPRERWITNLDQHALNALFQLAQSPFGADYAEDVHQLRPRLFRLLQSPAT